MLHIELHAPCFLYGRPFRCSRERPTTPYPFLKTLILWAKPKSIGYAENIKKTSHLWGCGLKALPSGRDSLFRVPAVRSLVLRISLITAFFIILPIEKSLADPLRELQQKLPDRVMAWTVDTKDRIFDKKTIFDYIDGAAEMYLSYNMEGCLSRRFASPNRPAIVLDIYDMGSSEDAFGVFTYEQDGDPLDVGQGALYRPGWLNFWKDRFFISVYAEEETVDAENGVKELGRTVAGRITTLGHKPDILLRLPEEGLKPNSIRYFHDYETLDYHYYLSDENILSLGPETKAVLAEYRKGKGDALILLVSYLDSQQGENALAAFRTHYMSHTKDKGVIKLENGRWSAVSLKGNLLMIVLEADSPDLAQNLLKHVK